MTNFSWQQLYTLFFFFVHPGSTFLTMLIGTVLVAHELGPFLQWIVVATADQVGRFLKSIGLAPLAEPTREVTGLPQS